MSFEEARRQAKAEKKFLRRESWSMSRQSIIEEEAGWFDAFGRPFFWSNADTNARVDADDWMVLGERAA